MILLLLTMGCPKPPTPPVSTCSAEMSWITDPTMPSEVAESESFCDFYQFSWQWFLAQTSPSSVQGERIFETNRVYNPNGITNQCSMDFVGKSDFSSLLVPRTIKAEDFEHVEADGGALYDKYGNILYYGVYYSQDMCSSTPKGFAPGTLEVKTSWMVLQEDSPIHYKILSGDGKLLGLVGMHMAIWTPNHPEMIWVTWQHKDNAPLCDGSSPDREWNFVSDAANQCLKKYKADEPYAVPSECSGFDFNTPVLFTGEPPLRGEPNNVCQEYAYGNEYGPSINGNDTGANSQAIRDLNESLVGKHGLLSSLPMEDPMQIWSNYEMVGGLWTKGGQDSGNLPVPHKGGEPDPLSPQRGSLELTNTTMETFQQGNQSSVPNCFGCHNYKSATPLTVSHIQHNVLGISND